MCIIHARRGLNISCARSYCLIYCNKILLNYIKNRKMYLTILFYTYLYCDKDENCAHSVQEEFDFIFFLSFHEKYRKNN